MISSIESILEDFRQGKMVILMDDEDRENEGDLMMAASLVEPEHVNFMTHHGRGLICLTLTEERCAQLNLPLMVAKNRTPLGTRFTVSIEAAHGVTTGISTADRATTIRAAVAENAQPDDLVQPGHIFPIMARPGGVLSRAGHTEAGCDLGRLSGLEPAAMIAEILNEDGSMARRPQLEAFSKQHNIKLGTVADLIRYRTQHEQTMTRVHVQKIKTPYGEFENITYRDNIDGYIHSALIKGNIDQSSQNKLVNVRVHYPDPLTDLVSAPAHTSWSLPNALRYITDQTEPGVIVLLGNPLSPEVQLAQIKGADDHSPDLRVIGAGSRILADLGVRKMRLLGTPKKYHALSGFNLEIVETVSPSLSSSS